MNAELREVLIAKYGNLPELSPEESRSVYTLLRHDPNSNYLLFREGDKKLAGFSLVEYSFAQQFPTSFDRRQRCYNVVPFSNLRQYYLSQVFIEFVRGDIFKHYEFEVEDDTDSKPSLTDYYLNPDMGSIRIGFRPHETFVQVHIMNGGILEATLLPFGSYDEVDEHRKIMEEAKEKKVPWVESVNFSEISFSMPTSLHSEIGLDPDKITLLGNGLLALGEIPQIELGGTYTSNETPPQTYSVLNNDHSLTFSMLVSETGVGISLEVPKIP